MATITAPMVKQLRDRNGAGMMECKKALVAADGDIEKAEMDMRKSGQATADKKAGRVAAEGVLVTKLSDDGKTAVMVEVNSETDFTARDKTFNQLAQNIASIALSTDVTDVESLLMVKGDDGETVEQMRNQAIQKIGENIQIRRFVKLETQERIGTYVHGGHIGVLVEMRHAEAGLLKDIAMHIAASNPLVVSQNDVPEDVQEREKEVFIAQAKASGKPMEIIEKMVSGRMRKFLDEMSLMGQPFIKEPSEKIADLLAKNNAVVIRFDRFVVGEGIEKKTTDFTQEVMQQAGLTPS